MKGTDFRTHWVKALTTSVCRILMLQHPAPHLPRMSRKHYKCTPSDTLLQRNCAVNAAELITVTDGLKKKVLCNLRELKVACEPHLAFCLLPVPVSTAVSQPSGVYPCLYEHACALRASVSQSLSAPLNLTNCWLLFFME